jgi:hypothetical protein
MEDNGSSNNNSDTVSVIFAQVEAEMEAGVSFLEVSKKEDYNKLHHHPRIELGIY